MFSTETRVSETNEYMKTVSLKIITTATQVAALTKKESYVS